MVAFEQLEQQRRDMIGRIAGWPDARLTFRPSPGSWSAIELFDHLVRTESGILAGAKRGLEKPHSINLRDRLGVRFIRNVFRSERRVKVPAAARAMLPIESADLAAVLRRWEEARKELAGCITEVGLNIPTGGVFRHPVGGWMSFGDVLEFFSVHMVHHGFQLARIEKAFNKRQPASAI